MSHDRYDPIREDPAKDPLFPARMEACDFRVAYAPETGEQHLYGIAYLPSGEGPHPCVLLLHGFPGNEKNLDLAQTLRRAGCAVVQFHYRGCWASDGDYAFEHVLEDVRSVVGLLRTAEWRTRLRIDPERFVIMGHSLGGFAALMTAAGDPAIRSACSIAGYNLGAVAALLKKRAGDPYGIREMFRGCVLPLKGTSDDILLREVERRGASWDVCEHAPALAGKDVLLVCALRDSASIPEHHHRPLVAALASHGAHVSEELFDEEHGFDSGRIALAEAVLRWMRHIGVIGM